VEGGVVGDHRRELVDDHDEPRQPLDAVDVARTRLRDDPLAVPQLRGQALQGPRRLGRVEVGDDADGVRQRVESGER
jgi:hypothetical protein